MDVRPKFSIIVPVYNVEKHLSRCLQSLVDQTFMDIEIICVNDGSTDGSLEILKGFAGTDNRIVIIDQENKGVAAARNAGIRAAEGEYILFVDSDDYITEDACDVLYRECVQTSPDMIVFGASAFPYIDDNDHRWLYEAVKVDCRKSYENPVAALFSEKSSKPFIWKICYNRSLFKDKGLMFREDMKYGEDMLMLFEAYPLAESVLFIPDTLYNYICARSDSLTVAAAKKKNEKMQWHLKILERVIADWSQKGLLQQHKKEFAEWAVSFFYGDLVSGELEKDLVSEIAKRFVLVMADVGLDRTRLKNVYRSQYKEIKKIAKDD